MFEHSTPHPPQSFEDTPFTFVSTPSQLSAMLAKLRTATEIAVDLEHHDYRTYYGFVCLMQISTREEDWVVDTLLLRDELEVLNEVFTDPDIVKVSLRILRPCRDRELNDLDRCSTGRRWISYGFSRISIYIL